MAGAAVTGAAALALFVLLRALGLGDFHSLEAAGPYGFLNVTKYPPSLDFLLMTLGANLVLLAGLDAVLGDRARPGRPLLVFGSTALFFYVVHFYLFAVMGLAAGLVWPQGVALPLVYPGWLLGLLILYPLCRRYGTFRHNTSPRSVWRYL
jgi:uncharacterized membrane protein